MTKPPIKREVDKHITDESNIMFLGVIKISKADNLLKGRNKIIQFYLKKNLKYLPDQLFEHDEM